MKGDRFVGGVTGRPVSTTETYAYVSASGGIESAPFREPRDTDAGAYPGYCGRL